MTYEQQMKSLAGRPLTSCNSQDFDLLKDIFQPNQRAKIKNQTVVPVLKNE